MSGETEAIQNDTPHRVMMAITTFANTDDARQFGTHLVESQLVACVNLVPGIESIYRWKGQVESEAECLVLMKTTEPAIEALKELVDAHHPYDEPELIVLPVEDGAGGYLDWVRREVRRG